MIIIYCSSLKQVWNQPKIIFSTQLEHIKCGKSEWEAEGERTCYFFLLLSFFVSDSREYIKLTQQLTETSFRVKWSEESGHGWSYALLWALEWKRGKDRSKSEAAFIDEQQQLFGNLCRTPLKWLKFCLLRFGLNFSEREKGERIANEAKEIGREQQTETEWRRSGKC